MIAMVSNSKTQIFLQFWLFLLSSNILYGSFECGCTPIISKCCSLLVQVVVIIFVLISPYLSQALALAYLSFSFPWFSFWFPLNEATTKLQSMSLGISFGLLKIGPMLSLMCLNMKLRFLTKLYLLHVTIVGPMDYDLVLLRLGDTIYIS